MQRAGYGTHQRDVLIGVHQLTGCTGGGEGGRLTGDGGGRFGHDAARSCGRAGRGGRGLGVGGEGGLGLLGGGGRRAAHGLEVSPRHARACHLLGLWRHGRERRAESTVEATTC